MLTNKATNGEMKVMKVFFRRVRDEGQIEMQMQADYQYRQSLMSQEFLKINEENVSATKFKERSCIRQLLKLIELGNVDTLYVHDASRLTRDILDHFDLIAPLKSTMSDLFLPVPLKLICLINYWGLGRDFNWLRKLTPTRN